MHHLTASEAPFLNSRIRDSSMKTENAKCSSGTWKSFSNSLLSCVHNEGPQGETVAIRREAAHLLQPPLSVKLKRSERSESLGDVASFFRNKNIELQQEQTSTSVVLFLSFLLRNRSVPVRQINTVSFFFFSGEKKKKKAANVALLEAVQRANKVFRVWICFSRAKHPAPASGQPALWCLCRRFHLGANTILRLSLSPHTAATERQGGRERENGGKKWES